MRGCISSIQKLGACRGDKDSLIVEFQEFGSEWNMSDIRDYIFIDAIIYRKKIQVSYRSCTASL